MKFPHLSGAHPRGRGWWHRPCRMRMNTQVFTFVYGNVNYEDNLKYKFYILKNVLQAKQPILKNKSFL
jgi:hypothetical protein